jgi:hypothetical protein
MKPPTGVMPKVAQTISGMIFWKELGEKINYGMLALLARAIATGDPKTKAKAAAAAAALVSWRVAIGPLRSRVNAIESQKIYLADTSLIAQNAKALNEMIYQHCLRAGDGKTWGMGPALMVSDPDCVKHILKDNFANYEKGVEFRTAFQDLLGDGIFNTNGAKWKTQRKTGVKIFTRRNFSSFIADVFSKVGGYAFAAGPPTHHHLLLHPPRADPPAPPPPQHAFTLVDQLAGRSGEGCPPIDIQQLFYKVQRSRHAPRSHRPPLLLPLSTLTR